MTHASVRTRFAVAAAIAATGLLAASLRPGAPARADEQEAAAPEVPKDAVWTVRGVVIDEQGHPFAGAVVRPVPDYTAANTTTTAADGQFTLSLGGSSQFLRGLAAEADRGARIGLNRYEPAYHFPFLERVRVMLKASRPVTVRVKDVAGDPVPGAAVEAIDFSFQTHATTGLDGTATLHVAVNAQVNWVIALKPGAGFDYFENFRTRSRLDRPPLPDEVTLTLDGAKTVRVKAVDSQGRPVPNLSLSPFLLAKTGKTDSINLHATTVRVKTDSQGVAAFDWLPKDLRGVSFRVGTGLYYAPNPPRYQINGPDELTARLLRATRLSGTVRFPDGRPAGGVLVQSQGAGPTQERGLQSARTGDDGSYALDVPPEMVYALAVIDEEWAAPTRMGVVVREGQSQTGLDFTLVKGALLRGRITEGTDGRPAAGAGVQLSERGTFPPKDLRGLSARQLIFFRLATADDQGRYHFRVSPGQYWLAGPHIGGTNPEPVAVNDQPEIVRDIALKAPAHATTFDGVVVEKTPQNDRPVSKAVVTRVVAGSEVSATQFDRTDEQGKFRLIRAPGELGIYARTSDGALAGFSSLPEKSETVRAVVAPATTVTGRVVDSNGNPQPMRSVRMRLDSGPIFDRSFHYLANTRTDEQGRFSFRKLPVGTEGELTVLHRQAPSAGNPRTVLEFKALDPEPVTVPDLIVPTPGPPNAAPAP